MRMLRHRCSKSIVSQWEKVTKCNFKSRAQVNEKCFLFCFFSNEMKLVFAMHETDFHELSSFFCRKVILVTVNAQNHFFRASKNTNSVFSATSKWWECEATDAQKLLSQSEKLLNAILRAKLNYMKNILSNEMNSFLQCRRQIFMSLSFLQKKSF